MGDLAKSWPVYLLLIGFIWFVAYVYMHSWKQEKNKEDKAGGKIKDSE